jgi:DNA-binding transcriptional LysR family regulator
MELTLAHLRTLQEVVRHGSFSRAAEDLHLSQPAELRTLGKERGRRP